MLKHQPEIEVILKTDAPDHKNRVHNRHLDYPLIYELATHPSIVERMTSLYGPDLLLWRTNFFVKEPGAKEIPWHQDFNYWPLEPPIIISAWIAIDSATLENSCLADCTRIASQSNTSCKGNIRYGIWSDGRSKLC